MQILELEAPFRKWADQPYPLGKFGAHFSSGHPHTPKLCCCLFRSNSLHLPSRKGLTALAVEDKEPQIAEEINDVNQENGDFESEKQTKPCELYVCNLPRCSDIADLVEMFKSFGSVLSVEVSRNPETGVSRGCGYITMSSIESARNAVSALDGSVECELATIFFIIIFGAVDSARVLYDRRGGKNRTYAFLSFSSSAERDAALSMNGTDFHDRVLVVKRGVERRPSSD
ncbi:hypothetical protein POTOM_010639 [Populus tomentosa]|uniref:RRM domain-containing protein n=1 Tax=Populus tomentosa TaxID=118781 RepID=A0A8X8DAW5_POPTO|nr:hypothetical protein POTOM_010639 [Populus tomentosa]